MLLLCMLLSVGASLGANVFRISNTSDFITFSNAVNNGANYSGTTVFLDSDIDLNGLSFEPIGKNTTFYFTGTFDGQGHTISNLVMNTTLSHAGLFGYSSGLTIKNVVIDDSCSFVVHNSGTTHSGSLVGQCVATDDTCNIESNVNMGSVNFNGIINGYNSLYIGGIIGYISSYSSNYDSSVKNCANYGTVTFSGIDSYSYLGGIVGYSFSISSFNKVYIQNCLNYGSIVHNGTTYSWLYVGEITAGSNYIVIENCVSAGTISSNNQRMEYIGSFVGVVKSQANVTHSFWTSNADYNTTNNPERLLIDNETSLVELNSEVVDKLNKYSSDKPSWNKWLLNTNNASIKFTINKELGFTVESQIVLLPDPAANNNESTFSGWYNDDLLTSPLNTSEVASATTLYGMLCASSNYTVALDVNGGDSSLFPSPHPMAIECSGVYGELPNATREGHTFLGWFTENEGGEHIESGCKVTNFNDHTLYAQWVINRYTLVFAFNNGTEPEVKTLVFNETIEYPKNMKKNGFTFNGWDRIINWMPAEDITITAQWREKPTSFIEIVFSKKDLSEEEVKEVIESYTDEAFKIIKIADSESGEIKVIVEFVDPSKSTEFVRSINEIKRPSDTFIKRVNGIDYGESFSYGFSPSLLLSSFII